MIYRILMYLGVMCVAQASIPLPPTAPGFIGNPQDLSTHQEHVTLSHLMSQFAQFTHSNWIIDNQLHQPFTLAIHHLNVHQFRQLIANYFHVDIQQKHKTWYITPQWQTTVKKLRYQDVSTLKDWIRALHPHPPAYLVPMTKQNALALAGTPTQLKQWLHTIKQLDHPNPMYHFHVTFALFDRHWLKKHRLHDTQSLLHYLSQAATNPWWQQAKPNPWRWIKIVCI